MTWKGARSRKTDLREYKSAHYSAIPVRALGGRDLADFDVRLERCDLLLLGDDHADRGLHARYLPLIDRVLQRNTSATLLVEFIGTEDHAAVDRFLRGGSDLSQLRSVVRGRWPASWMEHTTFDARFYRELMRLARNRGAKVRGLEPIPRVPLQHRDARMAEAVGRERGANPGSMLIVLVGHTHVLGDDHLRDRLGALAARSLTVLPRARETTEARLRDRIGGFWPDAPFLDLDGSTWLVVPSRSRAGARGSTSASPRVVRLAARKSGHGSRGALPVFRPRF